MIQELYSEISISQKITYLPSDIQKKLYIYCFRGFWRNYVPLTAQTPSWVHRANRVQQELYESHVKNIHFLHLSFNCLEANKQFIPGCQCSYCSFLGIYRGYISRGIPELIEIIQIKGLYENDVPWHERYKVEIDNGDWEYPPKLLNSPGIKEYSDFDMFYDSRFEPWVYQALRDNIPLYFKEE